jgi:hypothetical protein
MKKRFISIILAILMLVTPIQATEKYDINDALEILKELAGLVALSDIQRIEYDLDGDGSITINDALEILKALAGLIPMPARPVAPPETTAPDITTEEIETTVPVTTTADEITTAIPETTAPDITTTTDEIETTVPVTTTATPEITTPDITTTIGEIETTVPVTTTATPEITTPDITTTTDEIETTVPVTTTATPETTTPDIATTTDEIETTVPVTTTAIPETTTTPPSTLYTTTEPPATNEPPVDFDVVPGVNYVTEAGPGFPINRAERTGIIRIVNVSTIDELHAALADARPGDEIVLAAGVYLTEEMGRRGTRFHATASGTEENPIYLRSADPANPAVLDGGTLVNNGNVLYIEGGWYWIVEDLIFRNAQKGIVIDQGCYNIIRGCYVYNTGLEAIAIRDASSFNRIEWTRITDTGIVPGNRFNEGIYIGTAHSNAHLYNQACDYNVVSHCIIGPNVRSKGYTCKEGATGNIVEFTTFYGGGMQPDNSSRSFIELQGNDGIVRFNTFYRQNNEHINVAIKVYEQTQGWGQGHYIHDNVFFLDIAGSSDNNPRMHFIEVVNYRGSCTVRNNTIYPGELVHPFRPTDIMRRHPDRIIILD